jgi:hypothetical protein
LADAARCDPLVQPVAVIQYQARSRHNVAQTTLTHHQKPGHLRNVGKSTETSY